MVFGPLGSGDTDVPITGWAKVPNRRRYYNVSNPSQEISAYRYTQLRREYDAEVLKEAQANALADRQQYYRDHDSFVLTYQAKLASEGKTRTPEQILRDRTFLRLLREMDYYKKSSSLLFPNRDQVRSADGPYAAVLVELGRRLPEDEEPVGKSPPGHIDNRVMPVLLDAGG